MNPGFVTDLCAFMMAVQFLPVSKASSAVLCSSSAGAIDETEQQIISKVVANRLDSFDYGFVDILFNFAVSTRQQKNHDLAGLSQPPFSALIWLMQHH